MSRDDEVTSLLRRVSQLEAESRRMRRALLIAGALALSVALSAAERVPRPEIVTVRGLVVVDSAGHSRISIGDMPGSRRAPSLGIAIRDTNGVERFGVALAADGLIGMGFDAPRGAGDDANRERINISAGSNGLASIRFLDRKTVPRGYLMLTDEDRVELLLNADTAGRRTYHLYSALHDTAVTRPVR